jgi:cytochrome c553
MLRKVVLACLFSSVSLSALAELPTSYAVCASCHGANAEGNPALKAPALAGQKAAYIQRQLQNFKAGLRGTAEGDATGAQMVAFANMISESDAATLAAALEAMPTPLAPATLGGDVAKGQKLYNANCGDCHGAFAEGSDAFNAPKLVGQHDQYLFDQFMKYKNKQRGYVKEDKLGRQMAFMSSEISTEADLKDVVAYILSLQGN